MSRTDKTAPWSVKAFYYPSWVEESHDHTDGRCNLPDRPTQDNVSWGHYGDDCGWVFSYEFMNSGMARCSCSMCGYDAFQSVPRRKRQRIDARNYCRDGWMKEY